LFVAILPYAAVCWSFCIAALPRALSTRCLNNENQRLKVHGRVMQNTLKQLVWIAFCILTLATLLSPSLARVIPIVCVFFLVARLVYGWDYLRNGTLGRAPGVHLTFTLNISLLVATLVLCKEPGSLSTPTWG
jgi:hypothetical protein